MKCPYIQKSHVSNTHGVGVGSKDQNIFARNCSNRQVCKEKSCREPPALWDGVKVEAKFPKNTTISVQIWIFHAILRKKNVWVLDPKPSTPTP